MGTWTLCNTVFLRFFSVTFKVPTDISHFNLLLLPGFKTGQVLYLNLETQRWKILTPVRYPLKLWRELCDMKVTCSASTSSDNLNFMGMKDDYTLETIEQNLCGEQFFRPWVYGEFVWGLHMFMHILGKCLNLEYLFLFAILILCEWLKLGLDNFRDALEYYCESS